MDKPLIDVLWVIVAAGLVFLMQGGFLFLESGLTRTKNSINVAMKNLVDFGMAVTLFWLVGYAIMFGKTTGGIMGTTDFSAPLASDPWMAVFFLFQAMFVATAATIVSGAVAERMKFTSYIYVTIVISAVIYPFYGHWAWGNLFYGESNGWLQKQGFLDFAGSTVVHSVGGWIALAGILILGPRAGRFPKGEKPRAITGNNLPTAIMGPSCWPSGG